MKKLLGRRQRRGWSWAELSERSGLPVWKLQWWYRRFAIRRPARKSGQTFVPVQVVDSPRKDSSPVEVITPSGMRIRVAVDFNPEHLRRVIKALEPGC